MAKNGWLEKGQKMGRDSGQGNLVSVENVVPIVMVTYYMVVLL
jgi:hypothetical protein